MPARNVLSKPSCLSFDEVAAMPLVFLTAWTMLLERAQLRAGELVLVHAAGSGVGSAAIEIAKLVGAEVIATASTEAKRQQALDLGADHAVDYTQEDWGKEVFILSNRQGVDVVVEHVGEATFAGSLRALKKGGRLVTCGATSGASVEIDLRAVFFKSWSILGSTMGSLGTVHRILQLAEQGKLRPVLSRVLPLDKVREAHRLLGERSLFGKVVLHVTPAA